MSITTGWTRGQYGLYRSLFGLYLLQHFIALLPWGTELFSSRGVLPQSSLSPLMRAFPNVFLLGSAPWFVTLLLSAAAMLSLLFMAGKYDRVAAVALWYLWACLLGRNPLISNPSLPFVGWLLLAHLLVPSTSTRSWQEGSGEERWKMPGDLYFAAWLLMSLAYSYSGYTKVVSPSWVDGSALSRVLENPLARPTILRVFLLQLPARCLKLATWGALTLELSFAPLALFRRARPLIWSAMTCMHLGLISMVNFADLSAAMLVLHLFTFDPAWLPARRPRGEHVLFDGHCGLCHGMVRFVLLEDHSSQPFLFAPLQGEYVQRTLPAAIRSRLPESVVVLDSENKTWVESSAVIYILRRLGGLWSIAALILWLIPRPVRDMGYRMMASLRMKMFGATEQLCPILPLSLRGRFEMQPETRAMNAATDQAE